MKMEIMLKINIKVLIVSMTYLLSQFAFGQQTQLLERIYEGKSTNKNAQLAKKEILDQATDKTSEVVIKEIIGEAKYSRNKSIIREKIIKNSARYIPFTRPGELKEIGEEYLMSVVMKFSVQDLQNLLLENGLFYESDGTPVVMPLIRWTDKVNLQSFSWWKHEVNKGFLGKENLVLENAFKSAFSKNQFYVMRPGILKYEQIFSDNFRKDKLSQDDWLFLAKKTGAQIILDGDVTIAKSQDRADSYLLDIRISAVQIANGRSIGEISRQFETDSGLFEISIDKKMKEILEQTAQELAGQVFDAWSRGAIGSSLFKLTVLGKMSLMQKELFKETVKNKLREIKNIKERLISLDSVVYEIDSSISPKEIAVKMKEIEVNNIQVLVQSSSDTEITYKVQRSDKK